MPKKYIQLLLSINFCLTAIAAATDSDAGDDDSFVVIPDHEVNTPNDISSKNEEEDNWVASTGFRRPDHFPNPESSIEGELNDDSFVVIPDHKINEIHPNDIDWEDEGDDWVAGTALGRPDHFPNPESSIEDELNDQFHHIWHHLEKINEIHPSELLQRFLLAHQERPILYDYDYDESNLQKDLTQDISVQFVYLYRDLQTLSKYQFKEELDENSQAALDTQFKEICNCVDKIYDLYKSKTSLSKNDQLLLNRQLEELLFFSQNFLAEGSGVSLNELENNGTLHLAKREVDSTSNTRIELDNQFNQIWDCLDKMNKIHQSELLQRLISYHRDTKTSYNENLEEDGAVSGISRGILENQFRQLQIALTNCSQYQFKEELDEGSKANLGIQLDQIKDCLNTVYGIYDFEKESLSKEEKSFLSDQLEELHNFFYNLEKLLREESLIYPQYEHTINSQEVNIPDPLKSSQSSLDKIQMLLDSCKKEDSLIYPQYEYIINSQEVNISDLLKSSQTENKITDYFLYFNKAEGLIELEHEEHEESYTETYTTTWRIRPADVNLVKDWRENDPITIDKTSIFSKYTMRGESLAFTLNNDKKSVRANFVCKSSNQNTYTILSIDYLENIVALKNGPCLFVRQGDLKEWHVKDTVVLQKSEAATDTNHSYELINKTRNKTNWVFLKK
ncbi:MAG TPA: hypothetical protein VGZ69_06530 [Candidatus Rhabdochlamydia sp.]|jgi:hypothetical protein|nr:hypothetical protein [Candidatus Rhabdochlamydia sp.]